MRTPFQDRFGSQESKSALIMSATDLQSLARQERDCATLVQDCERGTRAAASVNVAEDFPTVADEAQVRTGKRIEPDRLWLPVSHQTERRVIRDLNVDVAGERFESVRAAFDQFAVEEDIAQAVFNDHLARVNSRQVYVAACRDARPHHLAANIIDVDVAALGFDV